MTEVLIEENFVHIDGNDMNEILTIVDRLGLEAEPTAPRHVSERHRWVLALHWLLAGPVAQTVAAALPELLAEICRYYVAAGKLPPTQLAVYGLDGRILRTLDA